MKEQNPLNGKFPTIILTFDSFSSRRRRAIRTPESKLLTCEMETAFQDEYMFAVQCLCNVVANPKQQTVI